MLKRKKIFLISIFTSSLLFSNEVTKLEEIIVNANKMEEDIQDVPQSISIITREDIEQKGIKNIKDIIKEIPNMEINNLNQASFRGLNPSVFTDNNPIVIYVDGIPYYSSRDFNPSLANVEQVEVLRGPQGTIYGKDAIGGVINIITKEPENEWTGSVGAEYGNDNYIQTRVNTSGALIDNKLYAGINGSFQADDGWIINHNPNAKKDANNEKDRKTSGFLLWKPTYNLSAKLTVSDNYNKSYSDSILVDGSKNINDLKRKDIKNIDYDLDSLRKVEEQAQALNISYDWEKVKFESITTHKKSDADDLSDLDPLVHDNSNLFSHAKMKTFTQEFKLSSKNQDIKWVTGLFFDKEKKDVNMGMGMPLATYNLTIPSFSDSETYAIFGQTMIPLGNSFELTLGGRYQKIKKEIDLKANAYMSGIQIMNHTYKDEKTWNSFLPKVALTYKINDNLSTYASFSKGYLPGGFNINSMAGGTYENKFNPQKSTNYEIGAKYIGDSFALNAAIFRMNIEDTHILIKPNPVSALTGNAKKSHSKGIELDGIYFISDNLTISGSIGMIQAEYDDYNKGTDGNFNGKRIENTPKYTANLGISYLSDKGVYGRIDFNAKGKTNYMDSANKKLVESDGTIITNLKIGYKVGSFDIYAFATNITNENHVERLLSTTTTHYYADLNDPRRYGLGMIYKF